MDIDKESANKGEGLLFSWIVMEWCIMNICNKAVYKKYYLEVMYQLRRAIHQTRTELLKN